MRRKLAGTALGVRIARPRRLKPCLEMLDDAIVLDGGVEEDAALTLMDSRSEMQLRNSSFQKL